MRWQWKLGCVACVFVCLIYIGLIPGCNNSSQSINLSDFEALFGHSYYDEMQKAGQRTYFESAVSDLVKYLSEETACCLDSKEAAAYLEYMLEEKGYEVSIVTGQGQDEIGIIIYDELQDNWVQWEWGTKSLSDFNTVTEETDIWSDWKESKLYEDIYQLEEESIEEFAWWDIPQAEDLDEFAQSLEYLPVPGFKISNVNAYVDEDNWEIVQGEPKATVHLSYIVNRYGDYTYEAGEPEIQLKIYDDDKTISVGSIPEDSTCRVYDSLLLSEGRHSIKVQVARLGTLAYGECSLDIHPASFYDELEKCTYSEVETFMDNDTTDQNEYDVDDYNCLNFTCDVVKNANSQGIKASFVAISYYQLKEELSGHAVACFDTIDQGLVFIEPQNDERIDLQYGGYYLDEQTVDISTGRVSGENCLVKSWPEMENKIRMDFFSSLNDDTAADAVISHLSLATETETSKDYIEDYINALYYDGQLQVSGHWDREHNYWDVLLQVDNPHQYQHGNEFWASAAWQVWDDGVVIPNNINALSIELNAASD